MSVQLEGFAGTQSWPIPNFFGKEATGWQKVASTALVLLAIIGLALVGVGLAGAGVQNHWWSAGVVNDLGMSHSILLMGVGCAPIISSIGVIFGIKIWRRKSEAPAKPLTSLEQMNEQLSHSIDKGNEDTKKYPDKKWPSDLQPNHSFLKSILGSRKLKEESGQDWGSVVIPNLMGEGFGINAPWKTIEDSCGTCKFSLEDDTKVNFYGVFDGHGDMGRRSQGSNMFFQEELPQRFGQLSDRNPDTVRAMLTQLCHDCNLQNFGNGGTTATFALQIEDVIYITNVGDSRAALVTTEKGESKACYQLTEDADPANPRFAKEIKENGHIISKVDGVKRVDGHWAVARDLGEEALSAMPDITYIRKDQRTYIPTDKKLKDRTTLGFQEGNYLVLATDGFWDVCKNSELMETINELDQKEISPAEMAKHLGNCARLAGSKDDITVLVIKL